MVSAVKPSTPGVYKRLQRPAKKNKNKGKPAKHSFTKSYS
jgi:hypothetical protein